MAPLSRAETACSANPLRGHDIDTRLPFRLKRFANGQSVLTINGHPIGANAVLRETGDFVCQLLGYFSRLTVGCKSLASTNTVTFFCGDLAARENDFERAPLTHQAR
jgi:hypothetical protein